MKQIVAVAVLCGFLLAGCKEDPEKATNKLFVESMPLWQQYQALPGDDPAQYDARLKLLTQVDENLKSILLDYPESSMAVELASSGSLKQLDLGRIEQEIPRLQQSIPAAALIAETLPMLQQYDDLPASDPSRWPERLRLLRQIDANFDRILKDYPLSYEAGPVENGSADIKANVKDVIPQLEQSIAAAPLVAETLPMLQQYQALPEDDPTQYEARLKLLMQADANLDKLLKDYPLSSQAKELAVEANDLKPAIVRLQQSIPAAPLMAKTLPLWEQYQAMPEDDPAQYEARLKLLRQVDTNLDKLLKDYLLSYEAKGLKINADAVKTAILRLEQSIPAAPLMAKTLPLWAQYQALPEDDPTQYEARLKLLSQIGPNLDKLLKDYLLSYEVKSLNIDAYAVKSEISRLQQNAQCAQNLRTCINQMIAAALKTADEMENGYFRGKALAAIAGAQAGTGDVAAALKTAKRLADDPSFQDEAREAFAAIAGAQAGSGDIVAALKTAEGLGNDSYRAEALVAIAGAQAGTGDVAAALRTAVGLGIDFYGDYRGKALAAIAGAQAGTGDVAAALNTAGRLGDGYYRAEALAAIAAAQAGSGDVTAALKTAERFGNEPDYQAKVLAAIAGAQAGSGDIVAALKTAEGLGNDFNGDYRGKALAAIAGAQAGTGDVAAALNTVERIGDSPYRGKALAAIAGAQAGTGDVAAALKTADGMGDYRVEALVAIVGALVKKK